MVRGKKPTTARDEAQKFAERMGYHWIANAEPDLPYDLVIFKKDSIRTVKVIQARNRIDPEVFYEKKYHKEAVGMRSLPLPPYVVREIWLKTRGEKIYRRLHVTDVSVGEIELWKPDGYVNPHARKDLPEKRGQTGKFIVSRIPSARLYPPTSPVSSHPPDTPAPLGT